MNRLDEARKILGELGFDQERCNARSAHVLLALLRIDPVTPWKLADNPMMGTRAITDRIRDEFGVDYKPNTRETIRRQTLHQFVEAGLVEENQDNPDRPINSPNWNHRITDAALTIIRRYGERDWEVRGTYIFWNVQGFWSYTPGAASWGWSPLSCRMGRLSGCRRVGRTT